MFSKPSRYRKLLDIVTTDAGGRASAAKELRILPEVSGAFLHAVEGGDRLDHLAYKFYKQPRKWWRVCDANSEFMSPQALLGKEPIVTDRFPLAFNDIGAQPPWSALLRNLIRSPGVEEVEVVEEVHLAPEQQIHDGQEITVYVECFERFVMITYNRMNISAGDLAGIITAAGFVVGQPENIGRVGKKITIPPDTIG